jgi:hypothetical protein
MEPVVGRPLLLDAEPPPPENPVSTSVNTIMTMWTSSVAEGVAVTVIAAEVATSAVQISAVPSCALARLRIVHVRRVPEFVTDVIVRAPPALLVVMRATSLELAGGVNDAVAKDATAVPSAGTGAEASIVGIYSSQTM